MSDCCRLHPGRPAVAVIHTDDHVTLTRRKSGNQDIPVCEACLRRWRQARAEVARNYPGTAPLAQGGEVGGPSRRLTIQSDATR